MIDIQKLQFTYPPLLLGQTAVPVLRDVTCYVPPATALAILGASGSGKSTLCHILAGLAPRYTGGTLHGTVTLADYPIVPPNATPPPVGQIGVLFQDATTQLFNHTVEYEVAWGLETLGVPPAQITTRVTQALAQFDLLALRKRPPWALSGGQQKRLALAATWALQPQVFLLDEPLGGLDPQGRADVLATLDTLRQQGTTLLLTTRRPQATQLAAQVTYLSQGILKTPLPTQDLPAQHTELVEAGIFYPPEVWPSFGPQCATADVETALHLGDVTFTYPNGVSVLHPLSLTIKPGEFVALIGPNGAGKSTLVRHFNGLLRPTHGRVQVFGEDAAALSVGTLARKVGFLFQRPEQQLFAASDPGYVSRVRNPHLDTRRANRGLGWTWLGTATPLDH